MRSVELIKKYEKSDAITKIRIISGFFFFFFFPKSALLNLDI